MAPESSSPILRDSGFPSSISFKIPRRHRPWASASSLRLDSLNSRPPPCTTPDALSYALRRVLRMACLSSRSSPRYHAPNRARRNRISWLFSFVKSFKKSASRAILRSIKLSSRLDADLLDLDHRSIARLTSLEFKPAMAFKVSRSSLYINVGYRTVRQDYRISSGNKIMSIGCPNRQGSAVTGFGERPANSGRGTGAVLSVRDSRSRKNRVLCGRPLSRESALHNCGNPRSGSERQLLPCRLRPNYQDVGKPALRRCLMTPPYDPSSPILPYCPSAEDPRTGQVTRTRKRVYFDTIQGY